MKEKSIVDESESNASLTLSEEESTAISKLIKAIALSCFNYDVSFRSLVEEQKLTIEEDLTEKWTLCRQSHRTM